MKIKEIIKRIIYGAKANSNTYVNSLRKKGMRIGENCTIYVPTKTSIDETRPWMIQIGDNVEITEGVTILTHGYEWSVFKQLYGDIMGSCGQVFIGNNCFIGMNTTILKDVIIGENCIIGANSVVTAGCYPDNSLIVGAPAKVVGNVNDYYEKRKKAQLKEALCLFENYTKSFSSVLPKEVFREFFWLFENREGKLIEPFNKTFMLGGGFEKSKKRFLETKPMFNSYEEFVDYCERQERQ